MSDAAYRDDDFARAMEAIRPDRGLRTPRLQEAARLLEDGRIGAAAKITQEVLTAQPQDVSALRLMAEIATRAGRKEQAESLLAQCVTLSPDLRSARFAYANALLQTNKPKDAFAEAEKLLAEEPRNPLFRSLMPLTQEALGDYEHAMQAWRALTQDYPGMPECWLRYGYALRALGERKECVSAFRKVIALNASLGEAYWALANLKTFRFESEDVVQIEAILARANLEGSERALLEFSLGKAYGDLHLHAKSFSHYAKGNALRRLELSHDPDIASAYVARCKAVFTAEFFGERARWGCESGAPIFIVGMLRSGSTLIEQMLASHSQIEGTQELINLPAVAGEIEEQFASRHPGDFPAAVAQINSAAARRLGERYLETVHAHLKLGRPYFTDKMGANYVHIGLLQLLLPNAKIIDVRRHPLACGWSNFTQCYAKGQNFAYRLADIGRVYRDYVELTAHFDRVLPGHVHRVFYESIVADPEKEVRQLLNYLGLPFEEKCLQYYATARAVTTVSSEQVRNPIYKSALDEWRHYEQWLGPLKSVLGPVLECYPAVPVFD